MKHLRLLPIRWRLTLLYAILLALFLLVLDSFAYIALRHALLDDQRKVLDGNARLLARDIESGVSTSASAMAERLPPGVGFQIYDGQSAYVMGSPGPKERFPTTTDIPRFSAGKNPQVWATVRREQGAQTMRWLVLAIPVSRAGHTTGYLRVASSLAPLDTTLADLARILVIGSLTIIAAALLLGPLTAASALRPVVTVARTAERLAAGDFSQRTDVHHGHDEIGDLARAFDYMATRLEDSFARQQALEERLRRFAADASHELRTPLTSLRGYVDVLLRGAKDDPVDTEHALAAMQRDAVRLERLMTDLLDLSRLDSGVVGPLIQVRLDDLVRHHIQDLPPDGPPVLGDFDGPVTVQADAVALGRAVDNLLQNASRYTPASGTVTVRVRPRGNEAIVSIADTGSGIPFDDLPHIFDPFYRSDAVRSRVTGGTGLGLSIVRAIVAAHGGTVVASSEPGRGSTFTISLPATMERVPAGPAV